MKRYFLRRLLLVIPTLFGITLMVFFFTRIVPGGPLERLLMDRQNGTEERSGLSTEGSGQTALSADQLLQLKRYYGLDLPWHVAYVKWLGQVLRGDLGTSLRYNEPVWDMMKSRFPISLFYGALTFIITYSVCIPLGILKAIRHKTWLDTTTSVIVFIGHAVPGFVLGGFLVVFFAARWRWFPLGGFTSMNFADLSLWGKVTDLAAHAVLPLICYLVGSFASTTLLIKNQLLDHLAADYMRTAIAKGLSHRQAVLRHALRNSLIPLATGIGGIIGIILTGSFLIETIFDIDGFGLLGYSATVDRDFPLALGILLIATILQLVGSILSDIAVALVDPRIKYT